MSKSNHNPGHKTIIASLKERRVPQIVGFYLGAGWGLIQFIEWVVERYGLSPYLPDISLVILISLIPSVLLIAYFHGKPGADSWTKIEKISIPINIVFTLGLITTFFSATDLSAATKTMVVTNENGETIQKTVAKKQFRKKIILFNLTNDSGDKKLNWLSNGFPMAAQYDLLQTPFIDVVSMLLDGGSLYRQLKRVGYPEGTDVPVPLMQKITIEKHYQYFLDGNFKKEGKNYVLILHVYQAKTGKEIDVKKITDSNLFSLIDKFSSAIKNELDIPDYHLKDIQDLPVAEILTRKIEAFKLLIKGLQLMVYKNDYVRAAEVTEKAMKIDAKFSLGYLLLGQYYVNSNHSDKAIKAINMALKYDFKLPEFLKFSLKEFYYVMKGQSGKRLALLKMQAQLDPENIDVKQKMANIYTANEAYDKAINQYLDMMNHTTEPDIYDDDVATIYIQKNQLDEAEKYFKKYAAAYPKEARSFNLLAYLYGLQGKDELVKKNYETSLFLEQDNLFAKLELASLEEKHGNLDKAFNMYQTALDQAEEPADKYQIYRKMTHIYMLKGQPQKALKMIKLSVEELQQFTPPLSVLIQQLLNIKYYVLAHKTQEGFKLLANIDNQLQQPFDDLVSLGYASIYLKLNNPDKALHYIEVLEKTIKKLGSTLQGYKYFVLKMRAKLLELQHKNNKALKFYQDFATKSPTSKSRFTDIGRIYRKLSKYEMAIKTFKKQLKISPFDPYVNYQMGLTYVAMEQKPEAKKYFQRAAQIWQEAEKDYQYAEDNKKQLLKLQQL